MARDWAETTLGERVLHAMKAAGYANRQNAFARDAKLPNPTLSRLANDKSPTAVRRSADVLSKIAEVAKVDPTWLARGTGEPTVTNGAAPENDEPYPSKRPAAAALRGLIDDQAIDAMLSEEHRGSTSDPGEAFWIGRAKWWHRQRQQVAAELKMPPEMAEAPTLEGRPKKGRKSA